VISSQILSSVTKVALVLLVTGMLNACFHDDEQKNKEEGDKPIPDTTIVSAPDPLTNSAGAGFEFVSSRDNSTFECMLDTGEFIACSSPMSYDNLSEGSHQFVVRAVNGNKVDASPASFSWEIDVTPPDTNIDSGPGNMTTSSSAMITFSANDANVTFQCSLDGAAYTECSSPLEMTNLSIAAHTFRVQATDAAGNTDPSPATHTWSVIVAQVPDTFITNSPGSLSNTSNAVFEFSSDDTTATFQCSLDSGVYSACTSSKSYSGLTQGAHTFSVRAVNASGIMDASPAGFSWVVDLTSPDTAITGTPANPTNAVTASFEFTATEAGSSFECSLDGAAFSACTSPAQYNGINAGNHEFSVRATDPAGNTDGTPAAYSWVVDLSAPNTRISSAPADPTNLSTAAFAFTSTEIGARFECSLDGAAFSTCSSPMQFISLSEGNHVLSVRAIDLAGNTDGTPASHSWQIDQTVPDTGITMAPDSPTNAVTASFEFTATEAGSSFECSLDSAAFSVCTSPAQYNGINEGNHEFSVRATDPAGNTDGTPASYNWEVDLSAPDTGISVAPDSPSNAVSASFEFTSTEAGSRFECSLDNIAYSACISPVQYDSLAEGTHVFSVRATDLAGNTDATAATYDLEIDLSAPDTTITGGPALSTPETTAEFIFNSTEAGSTFECALDDSVFSSCLSPLTLNGLSTGVHNFQVRATDLAGNADPTPASHSWEVTADTLPPDSASVVINRNSEYAIVLDEFSVRLTAMDNVGITSYLITEHNATDPGNVTPPYLDPLPSDGRWVNIAETANLSITFQYPLQQQYNTGDSVEVCAWFMDLQGNVSTRVCDTIVFKVTWTNSWGSWSATGSWEVGGPPTVGPAACYGGSTQCAGTVLNGNYTDTNANLTSPSMVLPNIGTGEELQLRFWHWFSFAGRTQSCAGCDHDYGRVYIEEETSPGVWSGASELTRYVGYSAGVWTRPAVDLSAYAGRKVRLIFALTNGYSAGVSTGWYLDDISVEKIQTKTFPFSESFVDGMGDWWISNGAWQIGGAPGAGPMECYNASVQCAATVLDGNYSDTNSNLVSPSLTLPNIAANEQIQLRFWHWFSFAGRTQSCAGCNHDFGRIYIQQETSPGIWSGATEVSNYVGYSAGVWTRTMVDLSAYAGSKVRILFNLSNGYSAAIAAGWYVDHVTIDTVNKSNSLPYSEDFSSGLGDWWSSNGTWQVGGPPSVGPMECYNGTGQCAGSVMDDNYSNTNSNLVSPPIDLPNIGTGEEIQLRFWHWFSFAGRTQACAGCDHDYGRVYIQTENSPGVWSAATLLHSYVGYTAGVWTRPMVDLSAYAGLRVRILFSLSNGYSAGIAAGWYIDDISIETVFNVVNLPFTENFENGMGAWWSNNGTWQVGGSPIAGPAECYNGSSQCAATVLDGDYSNTNSSLISPAINLPVLVAGQELQLRFWHWFSMAGRTQACAGCDHDWAIVYIQQETAPGIWSAVTELTRYTGTSGGVWARPLVDLSAYNGQTIRLYFALSNGYSAGVSSGWYVDDISISIF